MTSVPAIAGLVIAAVGITLAVAGVQTNRTRRAFLLTANEVEALVIDLRHRQIGVEHGTGSSGVWRPLVRFTLPDGRVVEAETRTGSDPAPARPGQLVRVRYDPEDPTHVVVAQGLASGALLGPLLIGVGVAAAVVGLLVAGGGLLVDRLL